MHRNANFANRGQCTLDEFDFYNVSPKNQDSNSDGKVQCW